MHIDVELIQLSQHINSLNATVLATPTWNRNALYLKKELCTEYLRENFNFVSPYDLHTKTPLKIIVSNSDVIYYFSILKIVAQFII